MEQFESMEEKGEMRTIIHICKGTSGLNVDGSYS
jgi:hypothetical protein